MSLYLGLDRLKGLSGIGKFLVGLLERPSFGLDVAIDFVELDDVDHPGAETGGSG